MRERGFGSSAVMINERRTKTAEDCLKSMPNPLKKQWQSLKRGRPGRRFEERYEAGLQAKKNSSIEFKLLRIIRILIALGAIAVGVVLVFIPGPAILFFLVAGSLLAAESIRVARFLDWLEVKLRAAWSWLEKHWRKLHPAGRVAATASALGGASVFAYAAYRLMTR